MDRLQAYREFFAGMVTASAGASADRELAAAFASTPREQFVGKPPWKIWAGARYLEAPSDDPAVLYQDVVVSLGAAKPLNNGQPSLHAMCLAALAPRNGETAVHVGAGTGYYTTLLAKLVGATGRVEAYEIEPDLAQRAAGNLAAFSNVAVHARSGTEAPLPACDLLYVNAGATSPLAVWLDALRSNGRLLFPLTDAGGAGGMLLITKKANGREIYEARFVCQALFVPCEGARDAETARRLAEALRRNDWSKVKSLHRDASPDASCWFSGKDWWLSTRAAQ